MTVTHRIALDPNDRQETLLRQHAGGARFAWNWGVAETRRALDAGEKAATSHYRLRPAFNQVKRHIAPWSAALSQNAAKYALIDLADAWDRFWRERSEAKDCSRSVRPQYRPPRFHSRKRGMAFRADNGPDTVRCAGRTIHLPKIGPIRTREGVPVRRSGARVHGQARRHPVAGGRGLRDGGAGGEGRRHGGGCRCRNTPTGNCARWRGGARDREPAAVEAGA